MLRRYSIGSEQKSLLYFASRTDRKKLCIITFVFIAVLTTLYEICCLELVENLIDREIL